MSYNPDVEYHKFVTAVLLSDGWHDVDGESFRINHDDSMWRGWNDYGEQSDCTEDRENLCFAFYISESESITGPVSSILAVRTGE